MNLPPMRMPPPGGPARMILSRATILPPYYVAVKGGPEFSMTIEHAGIFFCYPNNLFEPALPFGFQPVKKETKYKVLGEGNVMLTYFDQEANHLYVQQIVISMEPDGR